MASSFGKQQAAKQGARGGGAAPAKSADTGWDDDDDLPDGAEEIDDGDVEEICRLEQGDTFEGTYKGFKLTKSSKPDEKSTLHKFEREGVMVGLWGSYQLDQKLARAGIGSRVWIKYLGKEPMSNGNTLHKYRVARVAQ